MNLNSLLSQTLKDGASDLHLVVGEKPTLRVHGQLKVLNLPVVEDKELQTALKEILSPEQLQRFTDERDVDVAYALDGARFRLNLHIQRGTWAMAGRLIPNEIPSPESIGLNETLYGLTHLHQGFILVTGPTGCGKSTTLAVMINIINQERRSHIITVEDPVEFVYTKKQSLIEQREVSKDTPSFSHALKYILRQDPNIILIGEMRDPETIEAALTAAETGHLVFSTLHTPSAAETVERIIGAFPANQQQQILVQLAGSLKAVIAQQLLPRADDKGQVAAREILINTPAVANLIRENKISQINSVIQTSRKDGMITMQSNIKQLMEAGTISEDVAKNRIGNLETTATYF